MQYDSLIFVQLTTVPSGSAVCLKPSVYIAQNVPGRFRAVLYAIYNPEAIPDYFELFRTFWSYRSLFGYSLEWFPVVSCGRFTVQNPVRKRFVNDP